MNMSRTLLVAGLMLLCATLAFAGTPAPYAYAFPTWSSATGTGTLTDGWINYSSGNYTTGHDAANSVKLGNSGTYITSPAIDNPDVMRVWLKGNTTSTTGTFKIYARVGAGSFAEIRNCTFGGSGDIISTWKEVVVTLDATYRAMSDVQFKISYDTKVAGNVAVDDFSVSAVAATSEQDARLQAGGAGAQTTISSLLTTEAQAQAVFTFQLRDDGTGSAHLNTIINGLSIVPAAGNTAATWTNYLAGAKLTDGTNVWTGTIAATSIAFTGAPLATLVNGSAWQTWTLSVWLKTALPFDADNKILDFSVGIANFSLAPTGAQFNTADAAVESGIANNRVNIVATQFGITTQPPSSAFKNVNFTVRAGFTDVNGGIDADYPAETVTLSLATGTGTLSAASGLAKASVSGQAAWTDLQYNLAETGVSIRATATSFPTPVVTNLFNVTVQPLIVCDAYPLYWDGDNTVNAVPFAVHITISDWTTGANQDCYLKMYNGGSNPFHFAGGTWSSSTAYTTKPLIHLDANGNWSGWLALKSYGLTTLIPRVALSTATSTNLTGASITGTALTLTTAGNGAIIENRHDSYARGGEIVIIRSAASAIVGAWIVEDNTYTLDDGGTALPEGGWRLAAPAVCAPVTFERWYANTWPGHDTPRHTTPLATFCALPGDVYQVDVMLPVQMLGTPQALAADGAITLTWATASETDNARFEIVRNGVVVGTVDGLGDERHGPQLHLHRQRSEQRHVLQLHAACGHRKQHLLRSRHRECGPDLRRRYRDRVRAAPELPEPLQPRDLAGVRPDRVRLCYAEGVQRDGSAGSHARNDNMEHGRHIVNFDATNLPSGLSLPASM